MNEEARGHEHEVRLAVYEVETRKQGGALVVKGIGLLYIPREAQEGSLPRHRFNVWEDPSWVHLRKLMRNVSPSFF